ncbi:MAG: zinc-binding dehydrogenase, partial [Actinobacteria bacterium]|nr:zinc-binding dehydrogenase [Actinomycetota bacterium]
ICGSDVHAADGAWGGDLPAVYGHEAAGVVVELGNGVSGVDVGDHVVVSLLRTCGECFYCRQGQTHHCNAAFALDRRSRLRDGDGRPVVQGIGVAAFAEEVVVHESQLAPIARSIPLDAASLLACGVPTGYGAVVNTAQVPAGASVAVVGVGGVGVNCLQGAKAAGAGLVVAIDTNEARLAAAQHFGATHTAAAGPRLADDIAAVTGRRGADYVFVAVGNPQAMEAAFELARPGGTLVVVGMSESGAKAGFDMANFAYTAKRVIGSRMGSTNVARDMPLLTQRYLDGELLLDELISHRFTLDEINEAVAAARRGDGLRSVVVFEGVGT